MTDAETGEALLRGILDDPGDNLRRLIYADWLEENGQAERAEFIRVQIEIHKERGNCYCSACAKGQRRVMPGIPCWLDSIAKKSLAREDELIRLHGRRWLRNGLAVKFPSAIFRRGFAHTVRCPLAVWERHGATVVAAHPVEKVEVTDKRPGGNGDWWIWFNQDHYNSNDGPENNLPGDVFSLLADGKFKCVGWWNEYGTREAANDALSDALLLLVNRKKVERRALPPTPL